MAECRHGKTGHCKNCKNAAYMRRYVRSATGKAKRQVWKKANPASPEQRARKTYLQKLRRATTGVSEEQKKKTRERVKRWREANKAYANSVAAMRRKMLRNRRPKWADVAAIAALYAKARRLTRETGVLYTVDHIIPLRGKHVSGLHVENNLQVMLGADNDKKGASWTTEN